ncbi:MAG: polysaccharide pyruvyl transferase family protein [Candidatus Gracilibacteria bacterium]
MRIVIAGNYGVQNLGDEMILKGLLQSLRSIFPLAELTVLSSNPVETNRTYQVNSVEKFPAGFRSFFKNIFHKNNATSRAVKACDYFILGGGGLFGGPKRRANLIWGIQAVMAYFYGKKVVMYGQSIGPIKKFIDRLILKRLFKKAKLIIVRDKPSKDRLRELGIEKKVYVYPDLAFRFKIETDEHQREKRLIVALRQMENLPVDFNESISSFLNWVIAEHKWNVTFITFQKGVESDEKLHEEIMEMINDKSYLDLIDEHDIEKIIRVYLESEMVFGMRLHSLISAIKTDTPFMAINYAPKVKDFLESSGMEDHFLNLNEINPEKLKKQFTKVFTKKEDIISQLKKYNEKAKESHEEMEELLKDALT